MRGKQFGNPNESQCECDGVIFSLSRRPAAKIVLCMCIFLRPPGDPFVLKSATLLRVPVFKVRHPNLIHHHVGRIAIHKSPPDGRPSKISTKILIYETNLLFVGTIFLLIYFIFIPRTAWRGEFREERHEIILFRPRRRNFGRLRRRPLLQCCSCRCCLRSRGRASAVQE